MTEAIEKKQKLFEKGEAMSEWHNHQQFSDKSKMPKDIRLKRAIERVIDEIYEEAYELEEKIKKAIGDLEIK